MSLSKTEKRKNFEQKWKLLLEKTARILKYMVLQLLGGGGVILFFFCFFVFFFLYVVIVYTSCVIAAVSKTCLTDVFSLEVS